MAKLHGPFLGFEAHGTVGKSVQVRRRKRTNVGVRYGSHRDADTLTQQGVREHFSPVLTLWRGLAGEESAAWEYYAPRNDRSWSGYAYFCHINLARAIGGLSLLRLPPDLSSGFELDGSGDLEPRASLSEGRVGLFDVAGDGSLSPATGTWFDLYFVLGSGNNFLPRV